MYIIFYSQQYDIWVYPSNMHDICMVDPCRSNILDAKILDERWPHAMSGRLYMCPIPRILSFLDSADESSEKDA